MNPGASTLSSGRRRGREVLLLAFVAAGALGLRLYRLDFESLHMDEIVSVATYGHGPRDLVVSAAIVGQPPLDNLIGAMLYRMGLAGSDWWVRFPAAVFGAGGVFLLGWWVTRLAGAMAGVTAAVLLAVCPLHVTMSQEARPYALTFVLGLGVLMMYLRSRSRSPVGVWLAFAIVTFLFLLTRWTDPHFVMLAIFAHAVIAWLRHRRDSVEGPRETRTLARVTAAISAAYLCYLPFFWVVLANSRGAIGSDAASWTGRAADMLTESFCAMFTGYSERTVYRAQAGDPRIVALAGILVIAGLAVLVARSLRTRERDPERANGGRLLLIALVPCFVAYAVVYALFSTAIPKPQYLLPMAAIVCAAIGMALAAVRAWVAQRSEIVGALIAASLGLSIAIPMTRASMAGLRRVDNRDWRGVMRHLESHARKGDLAVVMGSDTVPPAFVPLAYGKDRYGAGFLKFEPIRATTSPETWDADAWQATDNTLWLLVYTDRMYLGFDQVPPPVTQTDLRVNAFDGLFLIGAPPGRYAMERLVEGIDAIFQNLPDGRAFVAPALFRSRVAARNGDFVAAAAWLDRARRQCRPGDDPSHLAQAPDVDPRQMAASGGRVHNR